MNVPATLPRSPAVAIRGTRYPVVLPSLRDPRLHLAAVIVSLQVLGQVAFEFRLSIAQILISIGTCAVLEVAIVLRRQRQLVWPASALLTGNGVAFVLRVPGTEHGDWWSTNGWWIFAGTAAVGLLSKYVIRFRGAHVFNPSNFGLVLCFLLLGPGRADPLDFWWGPMSPALALALAIIVAGGVLILVRLRLLAMALAFWLVFVAAVAIVAAAGHAITARWHLGPVEGWHFWTVLAFSPEILVFLFFMLTDPKTVPAGRRSRIVFGVSVALLAALLIAPARTEFWAKVAVLAALALVCAARPVLAVLGSSLRPMRRKAGALVAAGLVAYAVALVAAGLPARPVAATAAARLAAPAIRLPQVVIRPSRGVDSEIDRRTARQIAADVVAALPRRRPPVSRPHRIILWLEAGRDQFAVVVARLEGVGGTATTVELSLSRAGYRIARVRR
jgi:Na+-translocating ferredoxin:NAD+ oxidoreductase RnfD subunit